MSKKKLTGEVYSPSNEVIDYAHIKDWDKLNEFAVKNM